MTPSGALYSLAYHVQNLFCLLFSSSKRPLQMVPLSVSKTTVPSSGVIFNSKFDLPNKESDNFRKKSVCWNGLTLGLLVSREEYKMSVIRSNFDVGDKIRSTSVWFRKFPEKKICVNSVQVRFSQKRTKMRAQIHTEKFEELMA